MAGAASDQPGKVVILVADCLTLGEMPAETMPNLQRLVNMGAVGLMNANTAGLLSPANGYLSLGAGGPSGYPENPLGFNALEKWRGERVKEIYSRRTGQPAGSESVVVLDIAGIQAANAEGGNSAGPGALAGALAEAGVKVAVLGNADLADQPRREVTVLAMDQNGLVPLGDVSGAMWSVERDSALVPQTNYSRLWQKLVNFYPVADLLVIELGDTSRLDALRNELLPPVWKRERDLVWQEIDVFLGQVLKLVDLRFDQVMMLTPCPSTAGMELKDNLTPMIAAGRGISPGLLTSGTTRTAGLVANLDLAPTLLAFFQVPISRQFPGRVMEGRPAADQIEYLRQFNNRLLFVNSARVILLRGYVVLILLTLGGYLALFYLKRSWLKQLRFWLLTLAAMPLAFLLASGLKPTSLLLLTVISLALSIGLVRLALIIGRDRLTPVIRLCLLTAGFLAVDLATGAKLISQSIFGYDAVAGARYYGIGNEYTGVFVGALLIGISAFLEMRSNWRLSPAVMAGGPIVLAAALIGAPEIGANMGGLITAAAAGGYVLFNLAGGRLTGRTAIYLAGVAAMAVVVTAAWDTSQPAAVQSHFGRATALIESHGFPATLELLEQKTAMNLKLIRFTVWNWVVLGFLLTLSVLFLRPAGTLRRLGLRYPRLTLGLQGTLLGGLAALIVNDSGIVAASTLMICPMMSLLYLLSFD